MEYALDSSQQMVLYQIINAINEAIVLVNSKQEIVYLNKQYTKMFNVPEDLIKNKNYGGIKKYVRNVLLNAEQYFTHNFDEVFSCKDGYKDEIILKDGRYFTRTAIAIEISQFKCLLFSFRDITKEKKYESLLKKNQKKYQKLLNNIPNLVFLHDNFNCVYANSAAAKCLGYEKPKDLLGVDLRSFFAQVIIDMPMDEIVETNEYLSFTSSSEFQITDRNKNMRWLKLISCTKFQDSKNLWMSVYRDVTEKKIAIKRQRLLEEREERLEKSQKINQLKYEFFTNLSHELKTPINIISAASSVLGVSMVDCPEKEREYIDIIDVNCKRLTRGLNNFIDLEKIELGYFKINTEVCNIINIIENITLSVIPYADSKQIELIFDTDVEEKLISVDVGFMERIILNLLSNAIKFTKKNGEIKVTLKDLGEKLQITIEDTGIGIPQENLSYIFERFSQGNPSCEQNPRGSGLGLYLVKNMVEMMKGRIYVDSEIGVGTIFTIILPSITHPMVQENIPEIACEKKSIDSEITEMELSDLTSI